MQPDRLNGIKQLEKAHADHLARVGRFTTVADAVAKQLSGTAFAADGPVLTLVTLGATFTLRFTPDLESGGSVLHLLHVAPERAAAAQASEPVCRWLIDKHGNVRETKGQFATTMMQEPEFAVEVIERAQQHLLAHFKETSRQSAPK